MYSAVLTMKCKVDTIDFAGLG